MKRKFGGRAAPAAAKRDALAPNVSSTHKGSAMRRRVEKEIEGFMEVMLLQH